MFAADVLAHTALEARRSIDADRLGGIAFACLLLDAVDALFRSADDGALVLLLGNARGVLLHGRADLVCGVDGEPLVASGDIGANGGIDRCGSDEAIVVCAGAIEVGIDCANELPAFVMAKQEFFMPHFGFPPTLQELRRLHQR